MFNWLKTNEIAENVKLQKKNRKMMNENEQIEFDDQKDEEMVIQILKRMKNRGENIEKRIKYIKQFIWNAMSQICYKNNGNNGNDEDEQKINENNQNQSENDSHLSQLIDISKNQMCNVGHTDFSDYKDLILDNKCIKCGSMNGRKYCYACVSYKKNDIYADRNASDVKGNIYCLDCRKTNSEIIKKRIKTDGIKSEIIRTELVRNPGLEMDIICNMPRKAALNSLLFDINKLAVSDRGQWTLFMFDMDYLKAWNDKIGHDQTDKVIEQIGTIMHKYNNEINNGKWYKQYSDESLKQSFTFRTGGDEFVMVVKCPRGAYDCKLYNFYNQFKSEINTLGAQYNIKSATDRKGNKIDLSIVGISCGIYIPSRFKNTESNWLDIADTQALETAKKSNGLKKNGCCIYDEYIHKVIPNDKTEKCLKEGVWDGSK